MVGTNANFPSDTFRTAIRDAAKMAMPNKVVARPVFHWDPSRTPAAADSAGRPYVFDGTITTTTEAIADLYVETVVAVAEAVEEGMQGSRLGQVRGSKLTLTILDVDMATILGHAAGRAPDSVLVGDTEYRIEEIPKPDTLFDVDCWTVHAFTQSIGKAL